MADNQNGNNMNFNKNQNSNNNNSKVNNNGNDTGNNDSLVGMEIKCLVVDETFLTQLSNFLKIMNNKMDNSTPIIASISTAPPTHKRGRPKKKKIKTYLKLIFIKFILPQYQSP
ncbi:hypothetical protein Glove_365g289 [Diversispora epigaea]|uniref:Uncharacterized protein n=1 Tax=Diversispora epigaea TaxID=1348612 RepID=A0A397HCV7_9GLOM|nr:hypothetical protein Glove_365g289 [Diversispora epigaea]